MPKAIACWPSGALWRFLSYESNGTHMLQAGTGITSLLETLRPVRSGRYGGERGTGTKSTGRGGLFWA